MGSPGSGPTISPPPFTPRCPANGRVITPTSAACPRWPRRCVRASSTPARIRRFGGVGTGGRRIPPQGTGIPATRLVAYTCTHDQVGNRALGDRPSQNLTGGQLAVKAALVLGSPYTAMLFMGEEGGAATPFPFFSSHPE